MRSRMRMSEYSLRESSNDVRSGPSPHPLYGRQDVRRTYGVGVQYVGVQLCHVTDGYEVPLLLRETMAVRMARMPTSAANQRARFPPVVVVKAGRLRNSNGPYGIVESVD